MTPQEKAMEIFNSMKGFRVKHSHAKKCAINAVQLLIKHGGVAEYKYWHRVAASIKMIKTP
jgi:hypothetical protein